MEAADVVGLIVEVYEDVVDEAAVELGSEPHLALLFLAESVLGNQIRWLFGGVHFGNLGFLNMINRLNSLRKFNVWIS